MRVWEGESDRDRESGEMIGGRAFDLHAQFTSDDYT